MQLRRPLRRTYSAHLTKTIQIGFLFFFWKKKKFTNLFFFFFLYSKNEKNNPTVWIYCNHLKKKRKIVQSTSFKMANCPFKESICLNFGCWFLQISLKLYRIPIESSGSGPKRLILTRIWCFNIETNQNDGNCRCSLTKSQLKWSERRPSVGLGIDQTSVNNWWMIKLVLTFYQRLEWIDQPLQLAAITIDYELVVSRRLNETASSYQRIAVK